MLCAGKCGRSVKNGTTRERCAQVSHPGYVEKHKCTNGSSAASGLGLVLSLSDGRKNLDSPYVIEIKYLKRLLAEKDSRIDKLKVTIGLLNDKISLMSSNMDNNVDTNP